MPPKLIRITTVPLSLEKLLEGQLTFMSEYYEVTAVSSDEPRLKKYGIENQVRTYTVEMTREITPQKDLQALYKLYRFFKDQKPLIVHTHTPKAGIIGMLAATLAGVPIRLHTVAGLPLLETTGFKRKLLEKVEKITYTLATKVFPNSEGLKNIILQSGFTHEKKLKVLGRGSSNGIDTTYFDPGLFSSRKRNEIKKEWKVSQEDVVFLFIGRLVSEKGVNELVSAFRDIISLEPNNTLLLVGPFEEHLDPLTRSTLNEIENNPKIIHTGYQKDVRPFLAISDVLAFPSYREGFPNVVMQAGAMGIPAIVTDINGCNEIIDDRKNGLIIPPKNREALHKAMVTLIKDSALRTSMANESRSNICSNYERTEFWQILLNEYKTLEREITKV